MKGSPWLAPPLETDWEEILSNLARAHGWPTVHEPARLGSKVAALSRLYNSEESQAILRGPDAMAARLGFFFPRDIQKAVGALRELVVTGALTLTPKRALRVLDLGCGLGTMTWGLARLLSSAGARGRIEATLLDDDALALELAQKIARERLREGDVGVSVQVRTQSLRAKLAPARYDLILLGQVLSEVDRALGPEERSNRHATLIRELMNEHLDQPGTLVVVEPALRERTRHLHRVRDTLLATPGVALFAPCLHSAPCPALKAPLDWCHEDVRVNVPEWAAPVARAAGLRWEGLTFSYLVLRNDDRTLTRMLPSGTTKLRVVSERHESKGKSEMFLCGEFVDQEGSYHPDRLLTTRLDRYRSEANSAWDRLERGDLTLIKPSVFEQRPRVKSETEANAIDLLRLRVDDSTRRN